MPFPPTGGGGGGVTDHGALTGLADDDHSQYHNDSRGDARYSAADHDHDASYSAAKRVNIAFTFDGQGSAIPANTTAQWRAASNYTIKGWSVLGDVSGSISFDIWKDTIANYPPTDADSIVASAPPNISSATNQSSSTLTGWTTSISAGDILKVNVDSCTSITRAVLLLDVEG